MPSSRLSWLRVALAALALVANASAAQSPTPPQPASTATISGVVTDSATRRPIQGAIVTLTRPGQTQTQQLKQLTDATGRFVFARLPGADNYGVTVAKLGYFDGAFGRDQRNMGSRTVTVAESGWFGEAHVVLRRPAAIGGTVVDEFNHPVVGAHVRVLRRIVVSGQLQTAAGPITKTDDRGMYRVGGLFPGEYLVNLPSVQASVPSATVIDAPGVWTDPANRLILGTYVTPPSAADGRPRAYPVLFHPAARTLKEAGAIALDYGQDRADLDFQMRPVAASTVSGRVEASSESVRGLTLRLMPVGSESLGFGSEAATALAGANGSFTFVNVPEGEYTLIASHGGMEYSTSTSGQSTRLPTPPGHQIGWSGGATLPAGGPGVGYSYFESRTKDGTSGRTPVTVGARDVTDVVVTMRRGVSISGRFVWESGTSTLVVAGAGMAGARPPSLNGVPTYGEPADGDPALGIPLSYPSGEDNGATFHLGGLLPGEYFLRFRGLPAVKSIIAGGRDYTYAPFDTTGGRDFDDVVVTVTDKVSTVAGVVRDAQNAVEPNAAVICFPAERTQWTKYGFTPVRLKSVPTSTDGRFIVDKLPAGDYFFIAVDLARAGAWQEIGFLDKAAPEATRLRIDWDEAKTLDLVMRVIR